VRYVFELQHRLAFCWLAQPNREPAHLGAKFPADRQQARGLAIGNFPSRVAFELIASAKPQITTDRQKPPWDALRISHRVPHLGSLSIVSARGDNNTGGPAVVVSLLDRACHGTDHMCNVDLHLAPPSGAQKYK